MITSWLNAPIFPSAEQTRAASVVHRIILSSAFAVGSFAIAAPFVYPDRDPYLFCALLIAWSVVSLIFVRRGYVRQTGLAYVAVIWSIVLLSGFQHGGPRAPALVTLPVLILMSGFLAGARAAIVLGVLSALVTLVLTATTPAVVTVDLTPLRYWLPITVSVLMTSFIVSMGLKAIDAAIADARASERRNAEIVEGSPECIVSLGPDGVIESVNPAAARIGGFTTQEFEGQHFLSRELVAPEYVEWAKENVPKALVGEFTGPTEIEILRKDGSRALSEIRARRVKRADGSIRLQVTLRDLTERREAARELEDLQAQLLQSQKLESVGQLAGGVAHDFNNHLTVIRINSELLEPYVPVNSEGREMLAGIEMAAERSANLIRQLLAFSRKQILRPRAIDLNQLVSDLEPMLRRILPEDIALEISCEGGLWHVRADRAQIETALLNLVVNARDAMPEGGTLTVETANVTQPGDGSAGTDRDAAGDFVRIVIRDSGVGIGEADQDRVFEPFFSTKGEHGSGLGLSTVHGIVHQSGGSITLESEPDRGSRFLIHLPRVEAPSDVETDGDGDLLPERSEGRVLLVEDDEVIRALALAVLRARGLEVWAASDGLEALDLAKRENLSFDLLVTDVVMPRLGGFGLARALRDVQPELPVLFISGYVEGSSRLVFDDESGLLHKPFTGRALALEVHAMLSRS